MAAGADRPAPTSLHGSGSDHLPAVGEACVGDAVAGLSVRQGKVLLVRGKAPAIAKPSLGQVLGIGWLAWLLDRST